jgi:hypothetical protein
MTFNLPMSMMGRIKQDGLIQENVIESLHTLKNLAIVCDGGRDTYSRLGRVRISCYGFESISVCIVPRWELPEPRAHGLNYSTSLLFHALMKKAFSVP